MYFDSNRYRGIVKVGQLVQLYPWILRNIYVVAAMDFKNFLTNIHRKQGRKGSLHLLIVISNDASVILTTYNLEITTKRFSNTASLIKRHS